MCLKIFFKSLTPPTSTCDTCQVDITGRLRNSKLWINVFAHSRAKLITRTSQYLLRATEHVIDVVMLHAKIGNQIVQVEISNVRSQIKLLQVAFKEYHMR
jgi:hypothetical protein